MTALATYQFPATGQTVRTVVVDGEPWFVGRDTAAALGYANPRDAIAKHVPERHRGVSRIATPSGDQDMTIISEPGLYRLIMRSNTALAERFQEWVTSEVLPAIRKTGRYEATPAIPQTYAEALQLAADQARQIEAQAAELETAKPKAHSWDVLASGDGDFSVADAAKILDRDPGISTGQGRLFADLAEQGWIYRAGDSRWRAYQRAVDAGRLSELPQPYTNARTGETAIGVQVRITPKGLHELHRRLGGRAPLQLPQETLL